MADETVMYNGLDFQNVNRIIGLLPSSAAGQPVIHEQLLSAIEAIKWDDARLASTGNVNLATPGANMDGQALAANDTILLKDQTNNTENGLYIWTAANTPLVRDPRASSFDELEGSIITIAEGTANGGTSWRQTQVNGTLGTTPVLFTPFGQSSPPASTTVAGLLRIATQAEVDAGLLSNVAITPLTLATSPYARKSFKQSFGNASDTQFDLNHNLNTEDIIVQVFDNTTKATVGASVRRLSVNTIRINVTPAPALNALRALDTLV